MHGTNHIVRYNQFFCSIFFIEHWFILTSALINYGIKELKKDQLAQKISLLKNFWI